MLLSNPKIDYSSLRRMPSVKISGQTQGTTTINTMPTSTSLQDISSHHVPKLTWSNDDNKDQQLVNFSEHILVPTSGRHLSTSQSNERIFEHPEVTIIPSVLDDEIQRRLLTMKSSNPNENLLERSEGKSIPNTLEHPDMRLPVVMQTPQLSSSLSTSVIQTTCKQVTRTQSADITFTAARTPSPRDRVSFFLDENENSKRSTSPGIVISDTTENLEEEKNSNPLLPIEKDSTGEYSSSTSDIINSIQAKKNDL